MARNTDITAALIRKAIDDARKLGATDAEINSAKRLVGFVPIENLAFNRWIGSRIDKQDDLYLDFKRWSVANHWHLKMMTRSQFNLTLKKFAIIPNN